MMNNSGLKIEPCAIPFVIDNILFDFIFSIMGINNILRESRHARKQLQLEVALTGNSCNGK